MKKIVFLSLLIVSDSLIADSDPLENKNGHLALYCNLSKEGKEGYLYGYRSGKEGKKLKQDWKDICPESDYRDGFSLGYFHGKVIYLGKHFTR